MSTVVEVPSTTPTVITSKQRKLNTPKFSIVAAVLLISLAITAIFVGSITKTDITPVMGFIALAIPTLLSSAYAERNSNDLRNGVVQAKATQGAIDALHSTGVVNTATQIATTLIENKDTTRLAMEALARLLEVNTNATQANTTEQMDHNSKSPVPPVQIVPIPAANAILVAPAQAASATINAQAESAGGKTNG